MEKRSSWNELCTPEALRPASRSSLERAPTRPGERSPTKGSSIPKFQPKPPSRLRRCCRTLSFVPWWALLSLGLLIAGVVLVAIKGPAATAAADGLMGEVQSDTHTGFPLYMYIYRSSMWAFVGVGGGAVAFLVLGAWVRLDQRLRKVGKHSQPKGSYGPMLYKFCSFLDWVGLILVTLLALWMAVVAVVLASWTVQCWNLEQGASVVSTNMVALEGLAGKYDQTLQNFGAAVMAAAGDARAVNLKAYYVQEGSAPGLAAAPTVAAATSSPAPSASDPASGQVSATDMDILTSVPTTVPSATGSVTEKLKTTVSSYMAILRQYTAIFTEVTVPSAVLQNNGLCPSATCLNMALYPFTESPACMCTEHAVQSVVQLAGECKETAQWALYGVVCLCAGAIFAAMELAADAVLLSANHLFLRVFKRKSSRFSSRGSTRKDDEAGMSKQMMSPSMPNQGGSYPYLIVKATAHT